MKPTARRHQTDPARLSVLVVDTRLKEGLEKRALKEGLTLAELRRRAYYALLASDEESIDPDKPINGYELKEALLRLEKRKGLGKSA